MNEDSIMGCSLLALEVEDLGEGFVVKCEPSDVVAVHQALQVDLGGSSVELDLEERAQVSH